MKILGLDIERTPADAWVWDLYPDRIPIQQVKNEGETICWAAKFFDEKEMHQRSLHASGKKRMIRDIHKLLNKADVVVTYNGKKYDIPHLNKEFVKLKLHPPSPYKQIDLYRVVKQNFNLLSYKLEYVAQYFGIGKKTKHNGFDLWVGYMQKDPQAYKAMEEYNENDVHLLERLYHILRPWIKNHPNVGLFIEDVNKPVCPICGNKPQSRGKQRNDTMIYRRYHCRHCGTWARSRAAERKDRKHLLVINR